MRKPLSLKARVYLASIRVENGCWLWAGVQENSKNRYGSAFLNGRRIGANRFAYEAFNGPIPPSMSVCHRCDNTRCVNPDHLFLGSHQDNMADRNRKGRAAPKSKINAAMVQEIRSLRKDGLCLKEIASQFGITVSSASKICSGHRWRHVAEIAA